MPEASAGLNPIPVIAIDGPGGSGKGTVAQALARRLQWHVLDSGALYRLVGLAALNRRLALDQETAVVELARHLDASFDVSGEPGGRILLDGQDVSSAIRTDRASEAASRVATMPAVRTALMERQRAFRQMPGLVADGRDMGSVVFPDAGLKVFLTASVAERALRRYNQLKEKGIDVSLPGLSQDMAARDRRDAERSVAPLRACPDAKVLDTTGMSIKLVVSAVMQWAIEAYPDAVHPVGPAANDGSPEFS